MSNVAKQKKGVSFFYSIKFKIVLLTIVAIVATIAIMLATVIPKSKNTVSGLTKNYMVDVAMVTGESLDAEISASGYDAIMSAESLGYGVGNVTIKGVDSSYTYVVSAEGIMMYHPTPEKIGEPVENEAVKQLLSQIGSGTHPEPDLISYNFKGAQKYAAYYVGKNNDFILVVTADEADALSDITKLVRGAIFGGIFALVVCGVIGFFVASMIANPMIGITEEVAKLATLDFTKDETAKKKRKDEVGVMHDAIATLQDELICVVTDINAKSADVNESAATMSQSASETTQAVDQVETAMNEVADGATSQAQETQSATENIIMMGNMIEETNSEVEDLRTNARAMRDAGNKAIEILEELGKVNEQTKSAIDVIAEQTNVTNESAMKIKAATAIITDIAEETNLLSLNASIEAARAGEAGRGFAVVASQIQKLAEQSNDSAKQIEEIINLLIAESEKSVETMDDVKVVIEKQNENVAQTEQAFNDVKAGIDQSIVNIRAIANMTDQLDQTRVKVVDTVQSLTAIAEENAAATEETSASAAEVAAIMSNIADNAAQLTNIAVELGDTVSKFKI